MKILKFSAVWCAPCRALKSQLESYNGYVIEDKDFDTHNADFIKFGVKTMPTLIILDESENEIARRVGGCTLGQFEDWIKTVEDGKLEV